MKALWRTAETKFEIVNGVIGQRRKIDAGYIEMMMIWILLTRKVISGMGFQSPKARHST
jgi:hypothetical protein